jgi:hypothetical protein
MSIELSVCAPRRNSPSRSVCRSVVLLAACCAATTLPAQQLSPHASRVVAVDTRGNAGGGIFAPANLLGAPRGGGLAMGSLHVHSLGIGGEVTLGFDVTLVDGPGADLLVAENPFAAGGLDVFAEAVFVEISSDGLVFARLPSRYAGPASPAGPLGVRPIGSYAGLAGQAPVWAGSAATPQADPRDVVEAGGDAFDFADLAAHPLVVQGRVDLRAIHWVRLIDVRSGQDLDTQGIPILDAESGSADIDALTAIHFAEDPQPNGPRVDVRVRSDGSFDLEFADPDGLADLDLATLRIALFGRPIEPAALLGALGITTLTNDRIVFTWPHALPPELRLHVAASVKDRAGARSGDARVR